MMKEIKRVFQLILYGHGVKLNLIGGVLFWLLGVFMFWVPFAEMKFAAILYVMLGPLMLVQVAYTLLYSGIVAASPRRKLIEIAIPDWVAVGAVAISYVIVLINTAFNGNMIIQGRDKLESMLLCAGAMALVLIYYGWAYKYYWLSTILFFVTLVVGDMAGIVFFELVDFPLTFLSASLIGLAILAVGLALSSLIRRGVYKKALSPMAVGATLRKALQ